MILGKGDAAMKRSVWKRCSAPFFILFSVSFLLFLGCGANPTKGGGNKEPTIAIYAYYAEPVLDWDPSVEFSNGIIVMNNMYETLLRYDPENDKFEPVLATDYSKSPDSLSWTFKIRRGVKFHDGTDLNADAVKYSIDRTISLGKGAGYIWGAVKEIHVVDDYTVRFDLKYPAPLDLVASCGYAAFIVSPTAVKTHPAGWLSQGNDAGSGPYMLQSFKMGQEVVLTRFDGYWRGWEGKHYDKVVFQKIAETATRRQMIEKGDASFTLELPYEDVNALKSNSNVAIYVGPSLQNLMLYFNMAKKPLDNKLVRQALSFAFPYQDVVKYAGGNASLSRGAIPVGLWGHGDGLPQYSYDLEKAKSLLAQAGYPNGGIKLLVTYSSGDEAEKKSVELYKSELAKINVDLEIRAMPWASQWELAKGDSQGRQDIFEMYWWPDIASPYSWLFNLFHSEDTPNYNFSYMKDPAFDKLIDQGNESSGIDRRTATQEFITAQKMLIDQAAAIFAYDKKDVFITNRTFKGFKDNPVYPNVVFFYDTYKE